MVATLTPRRSPSAAPGERHLAMYRPAPQTRRPRPAASGPVVPLRPRLDPAVYRRRRLLAGGLFLLAVAAVLILAQLIQAGIGGGPLPATGAAATPVGPMIQAGARQYVVRPGDTVWSIANALDHGGDERPLVDALVRELHGTNLYPGQVVTLPGS